MAEILSPFPKVISTRINGRKTTRVVRGGWVIIQTVRPDDPNVIRVQWIAKRTKQGNGQETLLSI
jgi:hypothetical protein